MTNGKVVIQGLLTDKNMISFLEILDIKVEKLGEEHLLVSLSSTDSLVEDFR